MARMPEFEGHILFVEGYDLRLARRLVARRATCGSTTRCIRSKRPAPRA